MLKTGATTTVIAAVIATRAVFGQVAPTDTVLRAAFCIGALSKGIELFSKPPTPLSRWAQENAASMVSDFAEKRERLARFILSFTSANSNFLPLDVAMNEGAKVYQECDDVIAKAGIAKAPDSVNSAVCMRARPRFNLGWLPILIKASGYVFSRALGLRWAIGESLHHIAEYEPTAK
jgi:hypothetical protein